MTDLPLTLDQIAELIVNDARREADNTLNLSPVVKLTIPESNIFTLLVSIDPEFNRVYGLFTSACGKSELTTMKIDDLIYLAKTLNQPIVPDNTWHSNGTINDYYQEYKSGLENKMITVDTDYGVVTVEEYITVACGAQAEVDMGPGYPAYRCCRCDAIINSLGMPKACYNAHQKEQANR